MMVLDCETTGVDTQRDQIIELCIMADDDVRSRRFKPSIPVPAEATAVHGITTADLANCPTFAACAKSVRARLEEAPVIGGYNLRFDLEMIQSELERAGLPALDLSSKLLIDAMRLWQHFEPRTLAAAHAKFVGGTFDAHSAAGDVRATSDVLAALIDAFAPGSTPADLAALADPMPGRALWVGPSSHLVRRGTDIVFGFGKHEGQAVDCVDRGYLRWIQGQQFPKHVKAICAAAADPTMTTEQFTTWTTSHLNPKNETK